MSWVRRVQWAPRLSPALSAGRCWWKSKNAGQILNDSSPGHTLGHQKWWTFPSGYKYLVTSPGFPRVILAPYPVSLFLMTLSPSSFLFLGEEGWTHNSELGEPRHGCVPQGWAQQLVCRFTAVQPRAPCVSADTTIAQTWVLVLHITSRSDTTLSCFSPDAFL